MRPGDADAPPDGPDGHPQAVPGPQADPVWPERPVLLVHGILGQEILYWNLLRRRLLANGLQVDEVTLPALGLGDMREAALTFRTRLHEHLDRFDVPEVDVVAHSAGGLIARYFLKRLTDTTAVRRLITLGTPHAGTRTANLLPEMGIVGQARPGSAFLAELNDHDPTPPPTWYTAVWTRFDGVVLPAQNARLPPAPNVENVAYPGITHWGYLFGSRVARVLAVELRVGFIGGDRVIARRQQIQP